MEDRRGSVCEKHGEYSATGICRWCDPEKASSPPATGILPASKEPAPTCTLRTAFNGPACGAPATWRWNKDADTDRIFFCEAHHNLRSGWFPDWKQERIAPVASVRPKAGSCIAGKP